MHHHTPPPTPHPHISPISSSPHQFFQNIQSNPTHTLSHHQQEAIMHSKKANPNLEIIRNHQEDHQEPIMDSKKENPSLEIIRNHQQDHQEPIMDSKKANPNLETTLNHHHHHVPPPQQPPSPPPLSQDSKPTHHQHNVHIPNKPLDQDLEGVMFKNSTYDQVMKNKKPNSLSCSLVVVGEGDETVPPQLESGRDRLKRHRVEMSGRVWIPDIWGHEDLLKDWIDCSVFDSSLGNKTIMSARSALIQERRTAVRIQNHC